jgi:hypothetical protein
LRKESIVGSLRPSGFDVLERLNLTQDFGLNPVVLVDVEVENGGIARQIEVCELAAEAGVGRERRTPAAALEVVDGPSDIGGDGLGQVRSERDHEVHGNVAYLERTRDFDRVVPALGVAHEDERADLAGGAIPQDFGNGRRPIQVPAHLGIDPPRPESLKMNRLLSSD